MKKNFLVANDSDRILAHELRKITADAVIDAIAVSLPGINIPYNLAKAYLGRGMKLRQQRVLEWVEFVRDNMGAFSQKLFLNESFQDCFIVLLEAHTKERARQKRKIHQKLLLILTSKDKEEIEKFELERFIAVTNQISLQGLHVLYFIKSNLLSQIMKDIQKQLLVFKSRKGVEGIRLEDITRERIIVSEYIVNWIYKNYNINSSFIKKKYGLTGEHNLELSNEIAYKEHLKKRELVIPLEELANLGILVKRAGSPTVGGTVGLGFSISDFGYEYISYLDKSS